MTTATENITVTDFAARVLGAPLWPHQQAFAESAARYRVMCAGRQVGKSRALAAVALHEAATKRNALILIISAGEVASKRLLADCATLATGSALNASVVDASKDAITFSNGARILSVPASDRQIRGWSVDLLIVDEAGFISSDIWEAAEPAIVARPGSRVVLSSSPWGASDHFFRRNWTRGMVSPGDDFESWHWPSDVSPIADRKLIEQWRETWPANKFAREILAEWTEDAGAYFTSDELDNAKAAYTFTTDATDLATLRPQGQVAVGGLDWGFKHDANALALVSVLDDGTENHERHGDNLVYYLPHIEWHHNQHSDAFAARIQTVSEHYALQQVVSEENGIGQFATETLRQRLHDNRYGLQTWPNVTGVATTNKRKANGFGALKVLLQQGRIVLPEHPELLRQLNSLEFSQTETGLMKIGVPDNMGHDDLAMATMQAVSCISPGGAGTRRNESAWSVIHHGDGDQLVTGNGTRIRQNPRAAYNPYALYGHRQSRDTNQW